jgi:hypothetical protein
MITSVSLYGSGRPGWCQHVGASIKICENFIGNGIVPVLLVRTWSSPPEESASCSNHEKYSDYTPKGMLYLLPERDLLRLVWFSFMDVWRPVICSHIMKLKPRPSLITLLKKTNWLIRMKNGTVQHHCSCKYIINAINPNFEHITFVTR